MTDSQAAQQPDAPVTDQVRGLADLTGRVSDTVVRAARSLASTIDGRTVVIAIDGRSSTGKTSLADAVAAQLEAPVVHMDDLYPGWDGLAAAVPVLTDEVLIPLRAGEPGLVRAWDWAAGEHGEAFEVPAGAFVVVEGCASSVGPAGQLSDLRVWLEADDQQRRTRGLARDQGVFDDHWDDWAAQETELFAADETRDHADLVFETSRVD